MLQPFPKQTLVFTCLHYKSFENTVGKGEIVRDEQFLLFPEFSTHLENFLPFLSNLKLSSANSFSFFSFSHSVFYPFGELSAICVKLEIVICKLFQFGSVKYLSFGKGLNFGQGLKCVVWRKSLTYRCSLFVCILMSSYVMIYCIFNLVIY